MILLAGLLILLTVGAACSSAPSVGVTVIPTVEATVTAGGIVRMRLPTEVPVTAAPTDAPVPVESQGTPAYLMTALAQAPVVCPQPDNPPPPDAPATYTLYATVINQFLSAGGAVPFLDSILRTWGVVADEFGVVTDSYDLTQDGVYEVMVVIADPFNAGVSPQPGQLFVFGCHEGGYRLLYASDYGPGFGMPSLLHVGDINANTSIELVFFQERCQSGSCVQAAQVLSWSEPNEGFITLNVDTVGSADGRFSIADLDGDNVQEITIQGGGMSSDVSAGPPRTSTTVWDWNGLNYVRAVSRLDPPIYRIHAVHDADRALEAGDGPEAIRLYREALDNPRLGTWNVPNEQSMLRAYALYRLMLAYAYADQPTAALNTYTALVEENPQGYPSHVYTLVGTAFWRTYQTTNNLHTACVEALESASANPQSVLFLNSYGPANRSYIVPDMCPF
jgi:hypothetical protein